MRGKGSRKKRKERKEERKGRKLWSKVGDVIFLLLQDFQVSSKWNQGREAKENPRNK